MWPSPAPHWAPSGLGFSSNEWPVRARRHSNGGQEKLGARTRALRFTETCHWCASLCSLDTSYCRVFIRYSAATYYNPLRILMMIWMSTQYCLIVSRIQACCGIILITVWWYCALCPGLCVVVIFWVRSGYRNIWAQAVCPGRVYKRPGVLTSHLQRIKY